MPFRSSVISLVNLVPESLVLSDKRSRREPVTYPESISQRCVYKLDSIDNFNQDVSIQFVFSLSNLAPDQWTMLAIISGVFCLGVLFGNHGVQIIFTLSDPREYLQPRICVCMCMYVCVRMCVCVCVSACVYVCVCMIISADFLLNFKIRHI